MLKVVALFAALATVGCASSSQGGDTEQAPPAKVDTPAIEASLESALKSGGSGPQVKRVSCPSQVPARPGVGFECEVTGTDGLAGSVRVELQDAKGTSYSYKGSLEASGETQEVSGSTSTQ
jgi:hypothetical protein